MRHITLQLIAITALVATAQGTRAMPLLHARPAPATLSALPVAERLEIPARPPGWKPHKATKAGVLASITANVQARFEAATGSDAKLMTKQAASDSGWGWAVDHFNDIDARQNGAVSLDDVLSYMRLTSKVALPHPAASAATSRVIP